MTDPVIPKFSSFKSKPSVVDTSSSLEARPSKPPGERTEKDKDRSSRHKHRHQDRERERDRERDSRHRRSDHRHQHRTPENDKALVKLDKASKAAESDKAPEGLFFLDKRGDPLISRYGTNERGKVPIYRRSGRGRVLGSPGFLVMHRDGNTDQFSMRLPGSAPSALRDRHLFNASFRRTKPRRIKPGPDKDKGSGSEEDFVPLSSKPRQDGPEGPSQPEDDGPDYRSIEGKAKAHEFSDSELEYSSSDDRDEQSKDPNIHISIQLSRRVKEDPKDIEAWLELIAHQDVLLRESEGLDREATRAEVRSYAEIKLSMYESALKNVELPTHEERLLLGLMLEGAKVWSAAKLERRWEEVMKTHEDSFALWKARLDLKLSNVVAFQFQDVKEVYLERLHRETKQALRPASPLAGIPFTTSPAAMYEQRLYVFLRMTSFFFAAGYRELAVASWQALLEINLYRPSALDEASSSEVLDSFRDFWESEAPRIGEDGSLGWSHFVQANGNVDAPEPVTDDISIAPSRDVYKSWGATEKLRALASRRPARSMDEGIEDDPYRVVMFSDLEKLLFLIPVDVKTVMETSLVDAFLLFCNLPSAVGTSTWMQSAAGDAHIVAQSVKLEQDVLEKRGVSDPEEDQSKKKPDTSSDASHLAISPDTLFGQHEWFHYLDGWPRRDQHRGGPMDLSRVVPILRQATEKFLTEDLAMYRLALEWTADPLQVKKRARAILKHYPNSRRLYTAYARAEWANGNTATARQVFSAASDIPETSNERSVDAILLWTSGAWMELEAGDKDRATTCLYALVEKPSASEMHMAKPSPHQTLNTRQVLSSEVGYSFSASEYEEAFLLAEALALFDYLSMPGGSEPASISQGNLSAAMDRIWSASREAVSRGVSGSAGHERLLQSAARLLYFHASQGPFRSSYLREQLLKCIELFPRNAMFLSLYSWASSSFGINDHVRDVLRNVVLRSESDTMGNRIFAIQHELQRGNTYSTRAAFERALDTTACRDSAAIWRAYVRFCYARRELRGKAKEVFFRGIAQCPWSKDLAMEAFTTLINAMDEFDLRSLYNTMGAKGLRIHVDLDDFMSQQKR